MIQIVNPRRQAQHLVYQQLHVDHIRGAIAADIAGERGDGASRATGGQRGTRGAGELQFRSAIGALPETNPANTVKETVPAVPLAIGVPAAVSRMLPLERTVEVSGLLTELNDILVVSKLRSTWNDDGDAVPVDVRFKGICTVMPGAPTAEESDNVTEEVILAPGILTMKASVVWAKATDRVASTANRAATQKPRNR